MLEMRELPEELYVPINENILRARLPCKLRTHAQRYDFAQEMGFQFSDDFTENLDANWNYYCPFWTNATDQYVSVPKSAKYSAGPNFYNTVLQRKNLALHQATLFFQARKAQTINLPCVLSLGSWSSIYPILLFSEYIGANAWFSLKAIFYWDFMRKKRVAELYKLVGSDWILQVKSYGKTTYPPAGSIEFDPTNYWVGGPSSISFWIDDAECYGL